MSRRDRLAGAAIALVAAHCSSLTEAPSTQIGNGDFAVFVQSGDTPRIELRRRGEPLMRFFADGVQVGTVGKLDSSKSYDPYWLDAGEDVLTITPPDDLVWHGTRRVTLGAASAEALSLELELEGGLSATLSIEAQAAGRFAAHLTPHTGDSGVAVAYLRLRALVDGREGFYGLGEWADEVNHRGRIRPAQMEVDTLESANNENHVPVPLLLGTRGWGLFVESRRVGSFDVAHKQADAVEATFGTAEESAAGLRFHLFAAERPIDLLRRYYDVTGDPLLPAEWAYGPWIWRDENRDAAQVFDDIAKIRDLDLATSAIWIDRPYATKVNSFDFEKTRFPDAAAIVKKAHEAGLRVALWHTPYLEEGAEPFRAEALSRGYFTPQSGLLLNKWSTPVDFTNPTAFSAWQGWLGDYIRLGIEGFKLDYGEDIVPSFGDARNPWRFADGTDERVGHHAYTMAYHRAYAELLPKSGGFLLCRAGRWGDQKYASVIWPGDMDASFTRHREPIKDGSKTVLGVGGLPATVVQGLSLSASGFPFFAADTGGYRHSPPDRELFIRWFEQTALSAAMEIGDSSSQTPWEFTPDNGRDTEALDLYRLYTRLHLRLFPYAWTYAKNIAKDGRPIVRPFGLVFPELDVHPSDEYMFGDDLLVAPVLERGAVERRVILPPGLWRDFWDGTVYDGGTSAGPARTVVVAAPIGRLPLFIRQGAIVPLLRPTIDTLAPASDPGVESFANDPGPLYVHVVPDAAGSAFTLFDGTALAQRAVSAVENELILTPGTVFRSGVMYQIIGSTNPSEDGVRYSTAGGAPEVLPRAADLSTLEKSPAGFFFQSSAPATLFVKLPKSTAVQRLTLR